ncbi:MAG TPA: hypothetical protein VIN04_05700 [Myxococcota bacterium]|jgi:hypothetical protein
MADLKQAVALVTDPANLAEIKHPGAERRFAVNQKKVIRRLREAGAGKAEARELAIKAVFEAGGSAEQRPGRGTDVLEEWWVPLSAVRFED